MSQEKPLNLNARVKKTSHEFGEVELLNVSRKATPEQIKKFLILYAEVCPDAFKWSSSIEPPAAIYAPSTQPEPKLGVGDRIKQKIEKLNEANNNSAILARAKKALQEKKANEPLPQPKAVEEISAKPEESKPVERKPAPLFELHLPAKGSNQRKFIDLIRQRPGIGATGIAEALGIARDNTTASLFDLHRRGLVQRNAGLAKDGLRLAYCYSLTPATEKALKAEQGW